ncbi:pilus (MSHA type) biogenesis protein MshL [Denitratisoma sp. DHT3]|uniref:pilus (MSHA type) biogenesis protein MshL n=1 Tax=Denitratisoma sp. DHT3 TaxID=1981880 RepID=UPI00119853D1|nr:pilus (MSHA type) biogenesis protein MshL [Denitratisoma sp. DHT3]QDX81158.1 pilus (MSHA type) biogenesis protein MshL [Denitratisoma sp. DHT3]
MIPPTVNYSASLPDPRPTARRETYGVVVHDVKAHDLLFALARDARLNVDIHPGINGTVTLNAIDQTLPQLLARIARQVDMRWELAGPNLTIMPDTPHLKIYKVDYVNMSREASGTTGVSTQIASAGPQIGATPPAPGNASITRVEHTAKNHFWSSLERNIKDILRETDKLLPEGSHETTIERSDQQSTTGTGTPSAAAGRKGHAGSHAGGNGGTASLAASPNAASMEESASTVVRRATFREAASVIANPESGVVAVRATSRQHEVIQDFLDQVMARAQRQVLIEMTIAEVQLDHRHQQGINWQSLRSARNGTHTAGFSLGQAQRNDGATGSLLNNPAQSDGRSFVLDYVAPGLGISATLSLLEAFGDVRVLSSPKLSVLNNQTALLKVVNNIVYFEVKADTTTSNNGPAQTTFTTTPKSVSVGLVLSITPQIGASGDVLLNVHPSISRQKGPGKRDPNPNLPAGIPNVVPEIETREMESILRLRDGEIAVMGGLMQDVIDNSTDTVPGLSETPLLGALFRQRNESRAKTELVIFLRPIVLRVPSLAGDFRDYRPSLPGPDFLGDPVGNADRRVSPWAQR